MTVSRITLDTNILIYSIDQESGEKQRKAAWLIEYLVGKDCVLTIQALSEFYFAVTRKGKVPEKDATELVVDWQTVFPTITPMSHTLAKAIRANQTYKLSFWDAMLWAVAKENGVVTLYSEDFQHDQDVEGVRFINPFLP